MAKPRKKSIGDIRLQFDRIWQQGVRNSDAYKALSKEKNEVRRFQSADYELRNARGLSANDQRINDRINRADRTASRYMENLLKGSGLNSSIPYIGNSERRAALSAYEKKKFSRAKRMGMAGGVG